MNNTEINNHTPATAKESLRGEAPQEHGVNANKPCSKFLENMRLHNKINNRFIELGLFLYVDGRVVDTTLPPLIHSFVIDLSVVSYELGDSFSPMQCTAIETYINSGRADRIASFYIEQAAAKAWSDRPNSDSAEPSARDSLEATALRLCPTDDFYSLRDCIVDLDDDTLNSFVQSWQAMALGAD